MNAALPAVDAFYEQAACGLLATDAGGMIVRANATIHAWLGAQADALIGKLRFCDLLSVGARLFHHTRCVPLLELEGAVNEIQVDLHTLDGRRLPVLLNIVRRPGADGAWLDHWAVFGSTGRHAYEHALLGARKVAEDA
ncbi:MAG: PAS domain-containing protein, partial [Burkholderiaceae bacterium]